MAMCIRPSRSRLCPSTLFLSASSTSPGPRLPHYPCLLHSCSFRNNTHTPPTYPLASLRLPLLLSSLSQRTRAWLFAGSVDRWPLHHNGVQPTRLPGTLHDTRVTLSTHTGQALPLGQQFPVFTGCDGSLCTHRNTYISPCKWLYQELFPRTWAWLYLRAKAGGSAL